MTGSNFIVCIRHLYFENLGWAPNLLWQAHLTNTSFSQRCKLKLFHAGRFGQLPTYQSHELYLCSFVFTKDVYSMRDSCVSCETLGHSAFICNTRAIFLPTFKASLCWFTNENTKCFCAVKCRE